MRTNSIVQTVSKIEEFWCPKTFLMLVGAPGSGKSTLISALKERGMKFFIASTDDLIEIEAKKLGITYTEAFNKINFKTLKHKMEAGVKDAVRRNQSVVHDQTNMTRKSRVSKMSEIPVDYVRACVNFSVNRDVLSKRLQVRAENTGKVIPGFVLKNMFDSFQAPSKDEGFLHIIDFDNTQNQ